MASIVVMVALSASSTCDQLSPHSFSSSMCGSDYLRPNEGVGSVPCCKDGCLPQLLTGNMRADSRETQSPDELSCSVRSFKPFDHDPTCEWTPASSDTPPYHEAFIFSSFPPSSSHSIPSTPPPSHLPPVGHSCPVVPHRVRQSALNRHRDPLHSRRAKLRGLLL